MYFIFFFFFFQAEDGIRDLTVTGVQTCALPISAPRPRQDPGRHGCPPQGGPAHGGGMGDDASSPTPFRASAAAVPDRGDRERGGEGKRVDLGGRRII